MMMSSANSSGADADEPWSIFALTENLTNSYVDPSKLLNYMTIEDENVGMANFRSKKPNGLTLGASRNVNPLYLIRQKEELSPSEIARARWKSAGRKVRYLQDPWAEFSIDSLPTEHCIRHRYNAIKKEWIKDECVVKIESKQFSCGAMRGCYRL